MPVTAGTLALQAQLDAELQRITDAQTRLLVEAWVIAWSEIAADLQDTLTDLLVAAAQNVTMVGRSRPRITATTLRRSIRLRQVLASITTQLDRLAGEVNIVLTADLTDLTDRAARAQADILRTQLPANQSAWDLVDTDWTPADDDALAAIVRRTTQRIESATNRLSQTTADAVRRELIRGVAVGSNPRETARRIVERTEGEFNGGLTRALVIARSETLDAHRAAAKAGQDQQVGVLAGWYWLCHLGPRTCPSCLVKHGTLYPLDESGPHDHPQGRCARLLKAKSWADLGIDIDEPDDVFPDAVAWFDALTVDEQVAILGRERLRMLRAGEITWDELTTLRHNAGWRDSWQVTSLKDLRRRARAGAA